MSARAILSNELACPALTYIGPVFASEAEAEEWAIRWFGNPRRKRSFASMLVEVNGATREVVRGTAPGRGQAGAGSCAVCAALPGEAHASSCVVDGPHER